MAVISAAKVEANRRNAQKSTGPRTAEGKARSRGNAVKHGLTGSGVALLGEDAAAVELRFAALQEELRPSGLFGQLCVHQIALASVRVERAAREEAAVLEPRIRDAAAEFDRARLAEVDRLFDTIEACPGDHRRRLMAQPEGVGKLVAALESARDQLRLGIYRRWSAEDKTRVEALFGGTGGQFPATRTDTLLIALHGDASYFPEDTTANLKTKEERGAWASSELIVEVEAELARLAEARAALDLDALERDRRTAAARVPATAPDVDRLRKYGAAAARDFSRAYRDLRRAEAEAEAAVEPDPPLADKPIVEPAPSPSVAGPIASNEGGFAPDPSNADEATDDPPAIAAVPRPAPVREVEPTPATRPLPFVEPCCPKISSGADRPPPAYQFHQVRGAAPG